MEAKRRVVFITGIVGIIASLVLLFFKGFASNNILSSIIEIVGVILAIGIFDAIVKPKSLKNATQNAMNIFVKGHLKSLQLENEVISTINPKAPFIEMKPLYGGILEINISYKILKALISSKTPKANQTDEEKGLIYRVVSDRIYTELENHLNDNYGKKIFSRIISKQNGKNEVVKFKFDMDYFTPKPKEYEKLLIETCTELMKMLKAIDS